MRGPTRKFWRSSTEIAIRCRPIRPQGVDDDQRDVRSAQFQLASIRRCAAGGATIEGFGGSRSLFGALERALGERELALRFGRIRIHLYRALEQLHRADCQSSVMVDPAEGSDDLCVGARPRVGAARHAHRFFDLAGLDEQHGQIVVRRKRCLVELDRPAVVGHSLGIAALVFGDDSAHEVHLGVIGARLEVALDVHPGSIEIS
jgi:hypothetical protein